MMKGWQWPGIRRNQISNHEELADDDITAFGGVSLRTLKGKTVCNPPFGVLAEVPSGLSVYKYQVCS